LISRLRSIGRRCSAEGRLRLFPLEPPHRRCARVRPRSEPLWKSHGFPLPPNCVGRYDPGSLVGGQSVAVDRVRAEEPFRKRCSGPPGESSQHKLRARLALLTTRTASHARKSLPAGAAADGVMPSSPPRRPGPLFEPLSLSLPAVQADWPPTHQETAAMLTYPLKFVR
jgi:hypothetical protein